MTSPISYQLSLEDSDFVVTGLRCFAASPRTKKLKDNKEKGGENEIGYSWIRGDNESLHHGVSHKPGRLDLWKNKSDHKKKYETQEKVGRGRKNEIHVDETRN